MERSLAFLTDRLSGAYGERLVSVILYGSAAAGYYDDAFSDVNVFCVLTEITAKELAESEPIFKWWRQLGNPTPLLMTEAEARASSDSFPIEFSDMKARRHVLLGRDIIADLEVGRDFYRAQLEHDLRSQLLRLRQRAAAILSDQDALLRLCLDSVSTFCVLGRHALIVAGQTPGATKVEIVNSLEQAMGDMASFRTLLAIRERRLAPQEVEPATLFEKYLSSVGQLVDYVNRQ